MMIDSNANRIRIVTRALCGISFENALTLERNGFYSFVTMQNLKESTSIKKIANKERYHIRSFSWMSMMIFIS
jgi:hypothetical protein